MEPTPQSDQHVDADPLPELSANRSFTVIVEPDGRVRSLVQSTGHDGPVTIPLGTHIAALVPDGPDESVDRWAERLAVLNEQPATTQAFDVHVPPPEVVAAPLRRSVTAIPVAGRTGELESVVLRIDVAHEIGGLPAPDEDRFRFLAETLPQMLWMARPEGAMEYFSPQWEQFTGVPTAELLANGYHTIIHPDDLPTLGATKGEDGEYTMAPYRMRRHDGTYRWVEATIRTVRRNNGDLLRAVGTVLDVTRRIEAEHERAVLTEQLRAALEVAGMGRFELDLVSGVITGDARMEEVLGPSSIGGPPVRTLGEALALVHPDDQELVRTRIEAALAAGTDLRLEFRMLRARADGPDIRWLSFLGRVEHEDDEPVRMFGVVGDVTDRRSEDAARLRSQKREAIGTLAGGIAHDFNNIISAIWSNASVAQTEMQAGVSPETSINEIMRGAERAADVVRRLLSFSREEEPVRVPFDLGEVAREACELVRPTLDANVTLHSPHPRVLPEVHGSSGQLHQVVVNLVGNAGHAAADGGGQVWVTVDTIEVGATGPASSDAAPVLPTGRYVRMRVRDDGPGIAPEVMPRIFDPFFTTKAAGEGTGLGLAASLAIIRSHGGDITAETLPGNAGAVFTVVLPAGEAETHAAAAQHARTDDAPSSEGLPHVLFVDDDPALAKLAARALPLHGCAVTAFTDAAAGLSALRADPAAFDALVVDLSMPGMDGLDLLQAARDVRPDLALILTSGYLTPANEALAEQLGVGAVLHKPCSVGAIAGAVRELTAIRADRKDEPPR